MTELHGVLVIDKPAGPTSHDIVSRARRALSTRAVGHAGTLDPMATGVLVLLVGEGTKLSPYLTAEDKQYLATVEIGVGTDTLDTEGQITERADPSNITDAAIEAAVRAETARHEQIPPTHSAIKVAGRSAHARVRRGEHVELDPREVRVKSLSLVERRGPRLDLALTVSKGYYVRSLARDLGKRLDVPAHLTSLRRLSSGAFTLDDATAWPLGEKRMISVSDAATRALPSAELTEDGVRRAKTGLPLTEVDFLRPPEAAPAVAWLGSSGKLVAIGAATEGGEFRVARGFNI